jgi:hypothetical protein
MEEVALMRAKVRGYDLTPNEENPKGHAPATTSKFQMTNSENFRWIGWDLGVSCRAGMTQGPGAPIDST